jgi:hypothetical protein
MSLPGGWELVVVVVVQLALLALLGWVVWRIVPRR